MTDPRDRLADLATLASRVLIALLFLAGAAQNGGDPAAVEG